MMIRSPLGVYWSDTHEVQIGLDPRVALRLAGLSVAEQQAVSSLASVGTESEFLDACERRAVGEKRARSLLGTLRNSGLLDTSPPCFPDLTWRTVFVERLDALAVEICTVLAAGGLGYILTSDTSRPHGTDHPIFRRPSWRTFTRHQALQSYFRERGWGTTVIKVDAGACQVTPLGMERAAGHANRGAAAGHANRAESRPVAAAPGCGRPDFALVTSLQLPDPLRCSPWEMERIPYLLAYIEDIDIRVGPVVVPGSGPCARCLLFAAMDADPAWRYLAPQVFSTRGSAPFTPGVALAAALAVHGTLLALGGQAEHARGTQWVVPPLPSFPYRVVLSSHERCSCETGPAVA
ncbi:hypothetical protein ACGUFB_06850 [Actinotignum schaalii]|uniref:hypothetical protein n=1 Tax=Actinotignum TaxID=1653174 RepID=UPI002A80677E|nr:hypothetical protein [Actinotignum timonense]MDY5157174.1 hypothetical protein [Actinotignum timonense]